MNGRERVRANLREWARIGMENRIVLRVQSDECKGIGYLEGRGLLMCFDSASDAHACPARVHRR